MLTRAQKIAMILATAFALLMVWDEADECCRKNDDAARPAPSLVTEAGRRVDYSRPGRKTFDEPVNYWDANVLGRLWRIIEAARAAWEWWGLLVAAGLVSGLPAYLGVFEGQPWSVIALYALAGGAFWVVIAVEGKALIGERKRRRVKHLMALRAEGVQILNRPVQVGNDNDVILHRHAVVDWDERVGRALRESGVPESDIGWFTTLGLFAKRVHPKELAESAMYLKYQNILAEKLERLMEIAQRLEGQKE